MYQCCFATPELRIFTRWIGRTMSHLRDCMLGNCRISGRFHATLTNQADRRIETGNAGNHENFVCGDFAAVDIHQQEFALPSACELSLPVCRLLGRNLRELRGTECDGHVIDTEVLAPQPKPLSPLSAPKTLLRRSLAWPSPSAAPF